MMTVLVVFGSQTETETHHQLGLLGNLLALSRNFKFVQHDKV